MHKNGHSAMSPVISRVISLVAPLRYSRSLIATFFSLVLVVGLAACSGSNKTSASAQATATQSSQVTAQVDGVQGDGDLTGQSSDGLEGKPWAEAFRVSADQTQSDLARDILSDGAITDDEIAAVNNNFLSCVAPLGITELTQDDLGNYVAQSDNETDRATIRGCVASSGIDTVTILYRKIQKNPEELDYDTIMAECLVRKGVVEASYTGKDFAQDYFDLSFPFVDQAQGAAAFAECEDNPVTAPGAQ